MFVIHSVFTRANHITSVRGDRPQLKESKGVARGGGPGVPVSPLCKPFFKQTTYNIPWRKRHDDNV